jgi:hypothetical protein
MRDSGLAVAIDTGTRNLDSKAQRPTWLDPVETALLTAESVARIARERADWEVHIAFDRTQRTNEWVSRRINEQTNYDEKRRIELQRRETEKLDRLEWERQQRLGWDHRAIEDVRAGADAIARTASRRADWEQQMAFERTQSELTWVARREREQRDYDEKRRIDLVARESEQSRQLQSEIQERALWDRRAVECTRIQFGVPE